jgi:putative transcriptional regulator
MRRSVKEAVGSTVQSLINKGINTSFTEKEFNELGIEIPDVEIDAKDIQEIRRKIKLSQTVFAKILNVSPSSIRQWEQGKRIPSGSTKVLLELLKRNPDLLNYRIEELSVYEKQL